MADVIATILASYVLVYTKAPSYKNLSDICIFMLVVRYVLIAITVHCS